MGWQNKIDRLILKEIDSASNHSDRKEELGTLVQDYLRMNPSRSESFFALGYAERSAGVMLEAYPVEELEEESRLWHLFGRTLAKPSRSARRSSSSDEEGEEASEEPAEPDYGPLLQDPRIAKNLLPILLKQSLASGNLEDSVKTLESVLSSGAPDEETAELLRSTLSEILRRAERPREKLETSTVLGLLQRCMALPGFDGLPAEIRAPFHRTLGKLEQHVENYDGAADQFRTALEIAGDGHTLASVLHFDLAACLLRIRGVPDLEPDPDRGDVDQAMTHLDEATSDAKRASFNAYFARGVLRFEKGNYEEAAGDFRAAQERIEMYRNPLPVTLARIRYFLAVSLLRGGKPEDQEEAVRHLEKAMDRVRPDAAAIEELMPLLESEHKRTATRVLGRIDVSQVTDPALTIAVGKYYQRLGDAENALKVAELALEKMEDINLRREALLLELRAFNMLGERENAQDALYDLRDVCYQSGDLAFWEEVVFDRDLVGQALDRVRVLGEQAELLGRLDGREEERFGILREIAKSYLDRAEPHWKVIGLNVLKEAASSNPNEFEKDLEEAQGRINADVPAFDRAVADKCREAIGRNPTILVVGGDDHQDRREDDLDALASEWGLDAEWWATDYVNPDRVEEKLKDHLTSRQPDGLLILHWNRNSLVQDVRKLCRSYRVPTRFSYYVGQEALRHGVGELLDAAATQFGESNAAGA